MLKRLLWRPTIPASFSNQRQFTAIAFIAGPYNAICLVGLFQMFYYHYSLLARYPVLPVG